MLNKFRDKVSTGRLIKFWKNPEELVWQVATSLSMTIKKSPAVSWVRSNMQSTTESLQQENELRKQLAEIKEYVAKLEKEKQDAKSLDGIASMDDSVKIRATHIRWSSNYGHDITTSHELSFTWLELFSAIAPRLMSIPNEVKARTIIEDVIKEKINISGGHVNVNNEDFDTIKIQLIALGLIKVSNEKTVSGGVALFWRLTPKGESLMIQSRVVRKK